MFAIIVPFDWVVLEIAFFVSALKRPLAIPRGFVTLTILTCACVPWVPSLTTFCTKGVKVVPLNTHQTGIFCSNATAALPPISKRITPKICAVPSANAPVAEKPLRIQGFYLKKKITKTNISRRQWGLNFTPNKNAPTKSPGHLMAT